MFKLFQINADGTKKELASYDTLEQAQSILEQVKKLKPDTNLEIESENKSEQTIGEIESLLNDITSENFDDVQDQENMQKLIDENETKQDDEVNVNYLENDKTVDLNERAEKAIKSMTDAFRKHLKNMFADFLSEIKNEN